MQSIMFIAPVDLMDKSNGVTQKVINQYNAFCGSFDAYLAAFEADNVVIYHHNNLEYRDGNKKIQRVIRLNKVDRFIKEHHIENLYIRYMLSLPPFIKLLHNVKKSTKKIAIEIPDYPYTPQLLIKRQYARFICDWLLNRILKCYVNKVFICSKDKELFGIEATQLINGTDVEKYKMRNILNTSTEYIEVLSLSKMGVATAVDRFLLGMKAYEEKSGKRKIRLHMVGNGDCFEKYCSIINELQLNDSVVIYGGIPNDQLQGVFSKCDIGLGAIGFHRAHIHNDSTLKVREYGLRGMPIIAENQLDIVDDDYPYVMYCPYSEEPVDMETVVAFYDKCFAEKKVEDVASEIRSYFLERCDVSKTMKPIIDYFLN